NLPLPPDFTLITDCPIIAQPAIPPKKPVTILAIPCPLDSRFLSLSVSVISSTIDAVSKDSSKPTIAKANEKGKIIVKDTKVSGTFRIKNYGKHRDIALQLPTVRNSTFPKLGSDVKIIIAINGAGIVLINLGHAYTINNVPAQQTYVIFEMP